MDLTDPWRQKPQTRKRWELDDHRLNKPMDSRQIPKLRELEEALLRRKLGRFIAAAWPLTEPNTKFASNWHIDAIADHLEAVLNGQIKRLIINIPPRCGKSLITSVFFPSWAWGIDPGIKWIFATHLQSLAVRDSVSMRALIKDPWYQERYKPDPGYRPGNGRYAGVVLMNDQDTKLKYQTTARGERLATSVGSGLTGEGADIIVVDDPHDATEALTSEAKRQHVLDWWSGTLPTRLNPTSKYAAKIVIMQRLHEKDLVGYLLKQKEKFMAAIEQDVKLGKMDSNVANLDPSDIDWDHLCLPAEYLPAHPTPSRTKLGFTDPRKEKGQLLWPAGLPKSRIATLRIELGGYGASGQLDQLPAPDGGGMLKSEWFIRVKRNEWPAYFEEVIQSWDLSYSDDPTADYTAGFVLGRIGAKIYLITRIKDQLAFNDQLMAVKALSTVVPEAQAKYVEKAANARALDNTLSTEVPGIILLPHGNKSKVTKAMAWSPFLQAGNIHVPDEAHWVDDFLAECNAFPNGANDDQVDAVGQGISVLLSGPTWNITPDTNNDGREGWKY